MDSTIYFEVFVLIDILFGDVFRDDAIGLPLFGTLIAYLRKGHPDVGIIAAPALGETVYASTGKGCWYRKDGHAPNRIQTSGTTNLTDAVVRATGLELTNMDPHQPNPSVNLSNLHRNAKRFRWSGDCINYSLLCQGRIDAALDPGCTPGTSPRLHPASAKQAEQSRHSMAMKM
jgi:histidinol-phosphatase